LSKGKDDIFVKLIHFLLFSMTCCFPHCFIVIFSLFYLPILALCRRPFFVPWRNNLKAH